MSRRFAPLYILASYGARIAFLPLLVLLLPTRVDAIAAGDRVVLLSKPLLIGGIGLAKEVDEIENSFDYLVGTTPSHDEYLARYCPAS